MLRIALVEKNSITLYLDATVKAGMALPGTIGIGVTHPCADEGERTRLRIVDGRQQETTLTWLRSIPDIVEENNQFYLEDVLNLLPAKVFTVVECPMETQSLVTEPRTACRPSAFLAMKSAQSFAHGHAPTAFRVGFDTPPVQVAFDNEEGMWDYTLPKLEEGYEVRVYYRTLGTYFAFKQASLV